ncbi:MAG: sodium:solute symporter [Puniceicoccaceae bacterium]|nr:MAG: sodium:solute symporter [Puniceicoccaceae bacterium]
MTDLDWLVLTATILGIVGYGLWTAWQGRSLGSYLSGGQQLRWGTIGLSVMATQASAVTFLSMPGLGYETGLSFIQNYLGLPIALVLISAVFIPLYHRLKVVTAYEFLGKRFDPKTRLLGAGLFLIQRGLVAGITIYAPAIIVSTIFAWPLPPVIVATGVLVIVYTVSGGTRTVTLTQKYQMLIILAGMAIAFGYLIAGLPKAVSFSDALYLANFHDRLEAISYATDPSERYTLWTGLLGGTFLALSYFGTDQTQVQRYLAGGSSIASRLGLMFNAVLKIPMQFGILLLGVLLFVFYQFQQPPLFFNQAALEQIPVEERVSIESRFAGHFEERSVLLDQAINERREGGQTHPETRAAIVELTQAMEQERTAFKRALTQAQPSADTQDSDYIFLSFVLANLPSGLVGLLVAVIFLAAMSSTASELNALASTTVVDGYRNLLNKDASERHYLWASKAFTLAWGILAIGFAMTLSLFENLVEAVNIIGSLFYGTILGLFLIAFFLRRIGGTATFNAGLVAQASVIALYFSPLDIGYLWFNLIGCLITILLASVLQTCLSKVKPA